MAYIDRDKMLKYIEENNTSNEWLVSQYNADWIYSFIASQPTADVVEVVRCGNCRNCIWIGVHYCNHFERNVEEDDYCSYGG